MAFLAARVPRGVGRRGAPKVGARKGRLILIVVLALALLPFGVPRFFGGGDGAPVSANPDARVAKLCREHGGTPATAPASATQPKAHTFCTVRYGGEVYRMDAITPAGFDDDTAHFQRLGCEQAAQQQSAGSGRRRQTFVYHADTGVCEHRE